MTLTTALVDAEQLIQWLDSRIDGVAIAPDERRQLAAACLDIVLEHQKAVVLLLRHRIYGSAASLVCLVFESYVRGIWLHFSASEGELEEFKEDRVRKKFHQLIEDIEQHEAFKEGVLSRVRELSWKVMNSYKHAGIYQVVRRHKNSEISPNYSEDEILDVLESTNAFAILAAIAIADLADDAQLAYAIYERGMKFFTKNPNRSLQALGREIESIGETMNGQGTI